MIIKIIDIIIDIVIISIVFSFFVFNFSGIRPIRRIMRISLLEVLFYALSLSLFSDLSFFKKSSNLYFEPVFFLYLPPSTYTIVLASVEL